MSETMKKLILPLILVGFLSSCAHYHPNTKRNFDEAEPYNRTMFMLNDAVDTIVIRPVAIAYRDIVPDHFQYMVGNVISHAQLPGTIINNALQGEWNEANHNFARFFVNTFIGLGGLLNILPGEPDHQSFGDTLAHWGEGEGGYIILPLAGPSTYRDTVGYAVDLAMNPLTYLSFVSTEASVAATATTAVHERSKTIELTDKIRENSLDYYAKIRSIYLQKRYEETHSE